MAWQGGGRRQREKGIVSVPDLVPVDHPVAALIQILVDFRDG